MIRKITALLLTMFLSCILVACCNANTHNNYKPQTTSSAKLKETAVVFGQVIHISDGDTITVQLKNGVKFKVRLYGIDAPEKAQPYGPQSTGILRQLIGNQFVQVWVSNTDRYGRKVAKIYLNRQDINAEMIRLGAAWHYRYYDKSSDYDRYEQLERNARANHAGLWTKPNPMPPWDYRKMMREQNKK